VFGRDTPRRSRRPSIEHQEVAQILAALAQVRDRLDAIAVQLGEGGELDPAMIEESVQPLTEIRSLCFKALGRKP
jgi:hypothetical protein